MCGVGAACYHRHTTIMSTSVAVGQPAALQSRGCQNDRPQKLKVVAQFFFVSVCGIFATSIMVHTHTPHTHTHHTHTHTHTHHTHTHTPHHTHTHTHTHIRWRDVRVFPMLSTLVFGVGLTSTRTNSGMPSFASMHLTSSVTVCVLTLTTTRGSYLRSAQKQVQRSSFHMT